MANGWNPNIRPFDAQRTAIGGRRFLGGFDARFHSTAACVFTMWDCASVHHHARLQQSNSDSAASFG